MTQALNKVFDSKLGRSPLVRFVLVGGVSAVVDYSVTMVFTFLIPAGDKLAKLFGFILGTITAYMLNRRWTFAAAPSWKRFWITMAVYAVTFGVQWVLYLVTIPWLEGHGLGPVLVRLVSFVIAQGVATVINFVIQRYIIFRQ